MSSAGPPPTGASPVWGDRPGPGPATTAPACGRSPTFSWNGLARTAAHIARRAASPSGGEHYNGFANTGNCCHVPTGMANGDVMLAVISWTGGSAYTDTTPANCAMNMTNSNLTVAGADFNKELDVYTGAISIPVSVAGNATEYSYGFTKVGVPGAAGVAGTYLVRISVPTAGANSNIWVSAAVDHVKP